MDIDHEQARQIIQRIAAIADDVACQAGVGGMETAGSFVSFLAAHPEHIPAFFTEGGSVLDWPFAWHRDGYLSWHGTDGKIYKPDQARRQVIINAMLKDAQP